MFCNMIWLEFTLLHDYKGNILYRNIIRILIGKEFDAEGSFRLGFLQQVVLSWGLKAFGCKK